MLDFITPAVLSASNSRHLFNAQWMFVAKSKQIIPCIFESFVPNPANFDIE
jgi:hypothetical protein